MTLVAEERIIWNIFQGNSECLYLGLEVQSSLLYSLWMTSSDCCSLSQEIYGETFSTLESERHEADWWTGTGLDSRFKKAKFSRASALDKEGNFCGSTSITLSSIPPESSLRGPQSSFLPSRWNNDCFLGALHLVHHYLEKTPQCSPRNRLNPIGFFHQNRSVLTLPHLRLSQFCKGIWCVKGTWGN